MSSHAVRSERPDDPAHPTPVYTVYPVSGGNQGNLNYGFHHQPYHQAPPPKYEDVISGRPGGPVPPPQPGGPYEGPDQSGIIFVAPVYKYSRTHKLLVTVFTVLFIAGFVSILVKILIASPRF